MDAKASPGADDPGTESSPTGTESGPTGTESESGPTGTDAVAEPVTSVIVRRIRPGHEADYERWLEGIIEVARSFDGHQGITVLRPPPEGPREYTLVLRFRDLPSSRRWVGSAERAHWLELAKPWFDVSERFEATGLETWFTLPNAPQPLAPPRYKMALLTWLALYPLLLITNVLLVPQLGPLPLALRILIVTGLLIPLMTWVVMPRVTRLFWGWLHPTAPPPP